jgi:hypothetical protein
MRQSIEDEFVAKMSKKLATNHIEVLKEATAIHALFEARFPLDSGRIDWSLIANHSETDINKITSFYGVNRDQACKIYLGEQIAINELVGKAFWINDGFDIVLSGNVLSFESIFEFLLWPQGHIYLLSEKGNWCLNVTFEDDLYFGYAPSRETTLQ